MSFSNLFFGAEDKVFFDERKKRIVFIDSAPKHVQDEFLHSAFKTSRPDLNSAEFFLF